ncbi:MAG: hypothetical protein U1F67_22240 [Rubrivivax sp.]
MSRKPLGEARDTQVAKSTPPLLVTVKALPLRAGAGEDVRHCHRARRRPAGTFTTTCVALLTTSAARLSANFTCMAKRVEVETAAVDRDRVAPPQRRWQG